MLRKLNFSLLLVCVLILSGCKISGTITKNGIGVGGVTVTLSGNISLETTTNSSGYYEFDDSKILNNSYTVTPSGYTFYPESQDITVTLGDVTGVNFKITPLTLNITSPDEGETISRPNVMVTGTVVNIDSNETGVTVNGIPAIISEDHFAANHIPLEEGENTITATATDIVGNTYSISQTIYRASDDYIRITANPESGLSPLETTLSINGSFTIPSSSITYEGPGTVEILDSGIDTHDIRIIGKGVYYITAEVTDDQDNTFTDTVAIGVIEEADLNTQLNMIFNQMKSELSTGNVEGAVQHFSETSREKYRTAFNSLSGSLSQIASDMGNIELIYSSNSVAKYRMYRPHDINGEIVDITYYIYFQIDSDGLWRIVQL